MAIQLKPTGFKSKKRHVCAIKVHTDNALDVKVNATGGMTVIEMLKQVAQQIVEFQPPAQPSDDWTELMITPDAGTTLTFSFGVRSEYKEGE